MEKKKISVFRVEYDRVGMEQSWTAFIAAYSADEAVDYIHATVGGNLRINTCGFTCRLDAISNSLRSVIVGSAGSVGVKQVKGKPDEKVPEAPTPKQKSKTIKKVNIGNIGKK